MSYINNNTASYCDCFPVEIPNCLPLIGFKISEPNVNVIIHILDKFGKVYQVAATSDANSVIVLDTSLLPEKLLNPYAGEFLIKVIPDGLFDTDRLMFQTDFGNFPCLRLSVVDTYLANFTYNSPYFPDTTIYVCCCETILRDCNNQPLINC